MELETGLGVRFVEKMVELTIGANIVSVYYAGKNANTNLYSLTVETAFQLVKIL